VTGRFARGALALTAAALLASGVSGCGALRAARAAHQGTTATSPAAAATTGPAAGSVEDPADDPAAVASIEAALTSADRIAASGDSQVSQDGG
jgi:hypothetical protein